MLYGSEANGDEARVEGHGQHLPALRLVGERLLAAIDGHYLRERESFRNEIVWRKYAGRKNNATRKFSTQQETILFYVKTGAAPFNILYEPISDKEIQKKYKMRDEEGRLYREAWGRRYQLTGENRRIYLDKQPGSAIGSLWVEDGLQLNTSSAERTGYPTQKPLALYERIIKASSNPGDLVLDPFAGCATTCVAAERLAHRWVGVDYWNGTIDLIIRRLNVNIPQVVWKDSITHLTDAPARTDGESAAAPSMATPMSTLGFKRRRWSDREMRDMLFAQWGTRCWACDFAHPDPDFYDLDHITPKSIGGPNDLNNRAILCKPCNQKVKRDSLTLAGVRQRRGYTGRNVHPIDVVTARDWAVQKEQEWDRAHPTTAAFI